MKTLIALLALTFSVNAYAGPKVVYSCISDTDLLVTFNANYGELSVMKKGGEVLVDADDGYDHMAGQLESFPPQPFVSVWHHEETEKVVLSLHAPTPFQPYTGTYVDFDGKSHNLNCL